MSDDLDIEGLDEAVKLVLTDLRPALQTVCVAIAAEAQDRIAPYPAPSRKKQAFKTAKQRRGFFAKLRSGAIRVPYRRRGAGGGMLGGWVIEPQGSGVRLRNMRRGARWVHSATDQAAYHRGNWKTDKGVADEIQNDGTAGRMTEQAVQQAFDKGA